jgi:hypothetical protein
VAHTLDKAQGNWSKQSPHRALPFDQQRMIVEKATGLQEQALNFFLMTVGKSVPKYLDSLAEEERIHAIVRGWKFDADVIK